MVQFIFRFLCKKNVLKMNRKQNSLMRFSRTERLAQLSEQEIVIERKKREIQAKLEAQKKKETEEAFRKLESSKVTKNSTSGFLKKSWSGATAPKTTHKEKTIEHEKESLTNAFSNDGSFLDQFKKLSQKGLSPSNVKMQAPALTKNKTRDSLKVQDLEEKYLGTEGSFDRNKSEPVNDSSHSTNITASDPKVQLKTPSTGIVQLVPQPKSTSIVPSSVNDAALRSPLFSVQSPPYQVAAHNLVPVFQPNNMQLNSSTSNYTGISQPVPAVQYSGLGQSSNSTKQDNSTSDFIGDSFSTIPLASIQPPLPIIPQSISPPSPIHVQNIPPPSKPSSELPKIRSETISMTLKINTNKKLEAIPNPLEVDQEPSPTCPKKFQFSFAEKKESVKGTFPNASQNFSSSSILENLSSEDRESLRISSAFDDNYEEEEEGNDCLNEKYQHWAELVSRCGDEFEDSLRSRNENDPDLRFLLDKNSKEYLTYRKLVLKYRRRLKPAEQETSGINDETNFRDQYLSTEREHSVGEQEIKAFCQNQKNQTEEYLPNSKMSGATSRDCFSSSPKQLSSEEVLGENSTESEQLTSEQMKNEERRKRRRKSRWGDATPTTSTSAVAGNINLQPSGAIPAPKSTLLSQLTRSDPGLIQYARQTFGSTNLSEEDWKKAEDHYKINLLYQDMVKKRAEVEKLEKQGKFKYEYDSDEDTEGGTWEHKLRQQEMQATQLWAEELTRQAAGKHHIGDFLPPEELERFMEKYNAVKEGREPDLSDYKEYKLKQDNVGYRLLQKMGWNEGQGLGQDGSGITNPVNKATTRHENQGLGVERPDGLEAGDDEYDAYRKRMMLAYRFRPNPLNNPRRPYY